MRAFSVFVLLASGCFGQEPDSKDQAAMQATLTRYFRAINTCNTSAARLQTIESYKPPSDGLPTGLLSKLSGGRCMPGETRGELAVLVKTSTMIHKDMAFVDGFFRTVNVTPERAGRMFAALARQDGLWKIAIVRFARTVLESPNRPVPVAGAQRKPGQDGWATIDANWVVDLTGAPIPPVWEVNDDIFHSLPGKAWGRDIMTKESFRNFELHFEWKVSPAANSGVKYRLFLFYELTGGVAQANGYEYQIVDNEGDTEARQHPTERAASLYNQIASAVAPRPVGEWNEGIVIVKGTHVEHWLNGRRVLEFETESSPLEGPIVFQHHGGGAWLRNIRIRRLD